MALQKSVLNKEIISQQLKLHYHVSVREVQHLKMGSANCYVIFSDAGRYFLKEFQKGFSREDLMREADLADFLIAHGIPTARFYKTKDGFPGLVYNNSLICLEEFIEGTGYEYDNFPDDMLPELASLLGKMHHVLRDYPLPTDMGKAWLDRLSPEAIIAGYDKLIGIALQNHEDPNCNRILSDLQYKKSLVERSEQFKRYYENITYCPTHADYQGCQVIGLGNRIKAIIDFSSARNLPAVWEIMRSFTQSHKQCRQNAVIDVNAFCSYVNQYMQHSPLTDADLISMPYVYLFQLCISQYGYKQYLLTDSENKEELLQFAFWRTAICRELDHKADEISEKLLQMRNTYTTES